MDIDHEYDIRRHTIKSSCHCSRYGLIIFTQGPGTARAFARNCELPKPHVHGVADLSIQVWLK